jgi:hypothetical protein
VLTDWLNLSDHRSKNLPVFRGLSRRKLRRTVPSGVQTCGAPTRKSLNSFEAEVAEVIVMHKLLNSAAHKYCSSRSKSNSLASASIVEREENGPDHVLDVRAQDVLGVRGNKAIHSTGIPVTCIYCPHCTNHDNGT